MTYKPMEPRGRHPADPTGKLFGDEHWPLPLSHERGTPMKYMVIDVTTVEGTRVLHVGQMRPVQLLGQIYKADGKKVIAPPIEGRGFSKLEPLQLQYLYWNTCGQTPSDDYAEMIQRCLHVIDALPESTPPLEDLEREVAKLQPEPVAQESDTAPNPAPPKARTTTQRIAASGPLHSRPAAGNLTARVWDIADEILAGRNIASLDIKALRTAIIEKCVAIGINQSTAATQYSRWKTVEFAKK